MRLSHEDLDKLKEKYKVDRIWSFSRISTFLECPWAYNMLYIEKQRVNTDNVYTIFGTECHSIIQDFLDHKLKYEDMIDKWQDFVDKWSNDTTAFQFDTKKIESGYLDNLQHYFKHTDILEYEVKNEKPILINLKDKNNQPFVFVGYADSEYTDDDGNLNLIDFKTSSKSSFSPKNLPKKSMQLILYAIGEHQRTGLSYDKIKCRFDMQKYCLVHFKMENGKWKTSVQERSEWVYKMSSKLKTKLKKADYNIIEIDEMIIESSKQNSMDNLPDEIREQFYINNYYIEVPITEEICNQLEEKITHYCQQIFDFENKDDITTYLEVNFPYNPDNYYCKKLCAYHSSKEFKEENGLIEPQPIEDSSLENLFDNIDDESEEEESDLLAQLLNS